MKKHLIILALTGLIALFVSGCESSDSSTTTIPDPAPTPDNSTNVYNPSIDPTNFSAVIDNTYKPLTPGTTLIYEGETDEGELETITYKVTNETRVVMGVTCVVVRDTVTIDGELVEDTYDWFAQDNEGNVWYFGEDSGEYEDGELVGKEGSWEAGVDGAKPGIVMYADPASHIGEEYRQEYYEGEAEDMGKVVEVGLTVTAGDATHTNCIMTEDWTPLEPDVLEYKYYAPGIGFIREEKPATGEIIELVAIYTGGDQSYNPSINPANFTTVIDNTYKPLTPGTTLIYEGETDEGELEVITYSVTDQTRVVMGVTCVVVRDTVTIDGELAEDTYDWFTQDNEGNVWYFGEDSGEYEDGELVSREGSWEAGVDGAKPGIVMHADPASHVGEEYRQEYYAGEAEDMGKVVETGLTVTVENGTYTNCIRTEDWTPLEPDVMEYKYYAPGVGFILEEKPATGETVELVWAGTGEPPVIEPPAEEIPSVNDAKLLIEHNSTDEDTGFQGFGDGDPWNELTITGPGGENILTVEPAGGLLNFGLTELFFETSEPENAEVPIDDVLARLSEGTYTFTGDLVEAGGSSLTTPFSHDIPAGPVLLAPADGSVGVDPENVVVSWEPVTQDIDGSGIDIVGYQVIVEKDAEPEYPLGFARPVFSVYLSASATSVAVPETFLEDDACYKYEVLAIEESGNQTLASAEFQTGGGCGNEEPAEDDTPKMSAAKLLIEHNSTDEDTGFQGFADGDPWNSLTISGPDGRPILAANPENGLYNFGLTELFFETSEPENAEVPISDVLARLSEGTYTFTGDMVDGDPSVLTTTFTHKIPAGPELLTPADGSEDVDPDNVIVSWEPVTEDINGAAVTIVGYQVIVESDEDPEYPQGFSHPVFSIYLPASATSVSVPAEFMESDTDYKYEVLAIEESGNQTLASAEFATE